jgi:hypothetical protein
MTSFCGFGGKKCKLRCPKCRGQNLFLSEEWNGNGIYFSVKNGILPDEADDHYQGGPVAVYSLCKDCQHRWRVRGGVRSVWDLVIDEEES